MNDKGITAKHFLVAGSQGAILDLPLHMVDPRRPGLDTPAHLREPGSPPYMPELPVPSESILNYNQPVPKTICFKNLSFANRLWIYIEYTICV